ncbi:MAG: threonine/serine exporter family protein [Clostridiales bacterium]|nr:threonine/serine exporter family protein [Clostridiales bacterium]
MNEEKLLDLALNAGAILMESNAETYRVEDTIDHILSVNTVAKPQAFATATGVLVSMENGAVKNKARLKRVKNRSVNLEKISRINDLSRRFVEGRISLDDALLEIEEIRNLPGRKPALLIFCYGMTSAAFTCIFGGTPQDCISSFFVGCLLGAFLGILNQNHVSGFMQNLLGGGLIGFSSVIFQRLGLGNTYSLVIIGALMPLVPGVAITNAIRDIMDGDYLSGTSRCVEAGLTAAAIACGVGLALQALSLLIGGV